MRLLDADATAALTTNAVAAKAGVSIGTLYQYFDDRDALLDALAARELGAMSEQVAAALVAPAPVLPGERVRRVVRAVVGAYGGRSRVHRRLMAHALTRGDGGRLSPLYAQLMEMFTTRGVAAPGGDATALTPAQAFVLTHATAGVLRTLAASDDAPPLADIEDALVRLVVGYVADIGRKV